MKLNDFLKLYEENKEVAIESINVRNYLPIAEKYALAVNVADSCFLKDEDGILTINTFVKYMVFVNQFLNTYTNLDFEDADISDIYDKLDVCGALEDIIKTTGNEYNEILTLMNQYISEKMEYENSPSKIVAKGVAYICDIVEENANGLLGLANMALENIDINKILKVINKVM